MSKCTIKENQRLNLIGDAKEVWLFGYGSLIYKVDFPYLEYKPACIAGWCRKFWQGSHGHRGTQAVPGRVVTLEQKPGCKCGGIAFKIEAATFEQLDQREYGYLRMFVQLHFNDGTEEKGLVYIADPENEAYLGEASEYDIAQQIHLAKGKSGPNSEYLLKLAVALRELKLVDEHVFGIEKHLLAL